MSLDALPYDLLFNIAQYLTIDDVHSLQATCKSLRTFTLTRPVYRALAHGLLARSRPLPLPAFQRLSDLSTPNLVKAVDRAHGFEKAWRIRAPRPAKSTFSLSAIPSTSSDRFGQWYTKISAPPNEEIDWLSPITSSYTLCATKSGRVICWDVARDVCLAEWDPRTLSAQRGGTERVFKDSRKVQRSKEAGDDDDGDNQEDIDTEKKWELWKCRVEFDERAVYFTMARVLSGSYDDNRVMEFVLMKLAFPPEVRDSPSPLSQPLSFTPEYLCCSLPKSRANSPPPSSQGSSPQDSTHHSTATDSSNLTRSPLSMCTASPLPDCADYYRETPMHVFYPCVAPSDCPNCHGGRFMSARGSLRVGSLSETRSQPVHECKPVFFPLTSFHTTGVVMNVFLLDPPRRLLSAFVWVASGNTIGLYVLLDWAKDEYVFVDTGVGCVCLTDKTTFQLITSNWSCILHEDQIVIHSEEPDAAYQHFYPLNVLRNFVKPRKPSLLAARIHNYQYEPTNHDPPHNFCRDDLPVISTRLSPIRSISKKFVFPNVPPSSTRVTDSGPTIVREVETEETTANTRSPSSADKEQSGPSMATTSVEQPEDANEKDIISDDGSENGAEDDDGWSQEAVAESSRSKGKERADSEDIADDYDPGPLLKRTKEKGKMREVDAEQGPNGDTSQVQSTLASHQTPPGMIHSSSSISTILVQPHVTTTSSPAPNPYSFPPWYPESAHFVRQWWPTLPGVPRLSCTVVLLAAHDPDTHRTRFVLAQHYFRVPIVRESSTSTRPTSDAQTDGGDDEMLHLWYVSTPFEVVCVLDGAGDNDDDEETGDRPRPLVAVDFGHAVWIEYAAEPGGVYGVDASRLVGHAAFSDSESDGEDEDEVLFASISDDGSGSASASAPNGTRRHHEQPGRTANESTNPHDGDGTIYDPRRHRVPKCLRFVTFPPVFTAVDRRREKPGEGRWWREEAVVRTLEIPEELDLDGVETINIDQSQGAVILSVKEGKIFILKYE